MDEIFLNEFRPPDEPMIEFILRMSVSLNAIARKESLDSEDAEVMERASHSIKVMLAMAVGGHFLFTNESKHSDALAELAGRLYDHLVLSGMDEGIDIQALRDFQAYREEGPDVEQMPFLGDNSSE